MPTTLYHSILPAFRRVTTPEVDALTFRITTTEGIGDVVSVTLVDNDAGYSADQMLTLQSGNYDAYIWIHTVDENGYILTYEVEPYTRGTGYSIENGVAVDTGVATFDITTVNSNLCFALPIYVSGSGYNFNFVVDWGDETSDNITAYDDILRTHAYATAGDYDITITGLCEVFAFYGGYELDSSLKIIKLLASTGDIGLLKLDFGNCSNLNEVCKISAPNITDASWLFQGTALTTIPSNLFSKMTAITNFNQTFMGAPLTTIPVGLFDSNVAARSFTYTFGSCDSLATIPTDLFRYNVNVEYFSSCFSGCDSLVTIPDYLFRYNTECLDFNMVFENCYYLQLKINIFYASGEEGTRFLNKSVQFIRAFNRSTWSGTQGTAPDLWNCTFGTGTPTKTKCYAGAGNSTTSLTNYASIPSAWIL